MKIFTIRPPEIKEGVGVEKLTLTNGVVIDTVQVGEQGRGRKLGVVPVKLLSEWDGKGGRALKNVTLGTTQSGNPKFYEIPAEEDKDEELVLVFRTSFGFRGHNYHYVVSQTGEKQQFDDYKGEDFKIITRGTIADGLAGCMAWGFQYVVIVKPPIKFFIQLTGRLYGHPGEFYVYVKETGVSILTPEEEALLD
jgi:hypothetical protein